MQTDDQDLEVTPKDLRTGDEFMCPYPFTRKVANVFDEDADGSGTAKVPCWRPGHYEFREVTEFDLPETDADYNGDGLLAMSDGGGVLWLTVVGIYQPPGYRTRVFFTRQWVDPDGRQFGKKKLEIVTFEKFKRTARGYQWPWKAKDRGQEAVKE